MKPNIVFIHILKCGGTSLRYMLLDEYGYDAVAPVPIGQASGDWGYPTLRGVDPLEYQKVITPQICAGKGYQVVMSHYDVRIVSQFPNWHVITMLRHPVEQLFSLYKFMRHDDDLKRMHPRMQEQSFSEWVVSKDAKPYYNTQTRYLSGHGQENVDTAISNLMSGRVVFGIMEWFDDSIELFNEQFNWSMKPRHLNKTPDSPDLSPVVCDVVEKLQCDDMELYHTALDLFGHQFKDG